jgi:hypothetical protein
MWMPDLRFAPMEAGAKGFPIVNQVRSWSLNLKFENVAVSYFLVVCGKISPTRQPTLIVGGRVSKQGQFPWQVALYRFQTFICGGSLLNERLILTGKFSTVLEMELQHSKIQDVPE